MKKILALVEGQTEETFIRDVLNPYLRLSDKVLTPTLIMTKRVKSGPSFKGGITSWAKVSSDIRRLLRDSSARAITTMFDYYGLPNDFPGMSTRPDGAAIGRVLHVEAALASAVADDRFVPYLSLHEFEVLVYASLDHAGWVFDDDARVVKTLRSHLASVANAEEINEDPNKAPSRRILAAFPRYQKVLQGPMAVMAAGIPALRAVCPHFASWLGTIEKL